MTELVIATLAGSEVALVPLSRHDARAIVDIEDAPLVSGRSWKLDHRGYACHTVRRDGRYGTVRMHSLILSVEPPYTVDHINTSKLDNRKSNLRPATQAQQQYNRGPRRQNRSGFKGVRARGPVWLARIKRDGVECHLGVFEEAEAAARAYDAAARSAFGEFAWLNFPEKRSA